MMLSDKHKAALRTLPLPHPGDTFRRIATRPYSSTWRKSSKHWDQMLDLEEQGLVERTQSRGETLWRLTKPNGHAIREELEARDGE